MKNAFSVKLYLVCFLSDVKCFTVIVVKNIFLIREIYVQGKEHYRLCSCQSNLSLAASLKSSDYYWPEPQPVALRTTGHRVVPLLNWSSTLTAHFFINFFVVTGWAIEQYPYGTGVVPLRLTFLSNFFVVTGRAIEQYPYRTGVVP